MPVPYQYAFQNVLADALTLQWCYISAIVSQIAGNSTVCSSACSGPHQRKCQSSVIGPLWGDQWIHPTKRPVMHIIYRWLRMADRALLAGYPRYTGVTMDCTCINASNDLCWNQLSTCISKDHSGSANERQCYNVTPSLIGWPQYPEWSLLLSASTCLCPAHVWMV